MLNVHSHYSLRYGILKTEKILQIMQELGYPGFVLTDINSSTAAIGFVREAKEHGTIPRVGIDFRNGITRQFVGLACNNEGFMELNELLSFHQHTTTPIPDRAPAFKNCYVIYPWESAPDALESHEWIGVSQKDLNKIAVKASPDEVNRMVILQPMTFNEKKHFNMHRILRAIHLNTLLSLLPVSEQATDDRFTSYEELVAPFSQLPVIIENTLALMNGTSIHFDLGPEASCQNKQFYTDSRENDLGLLRKLIQKGLEFRYKTCSEEILTRVEKEISVIDQKNYLSYFLIAYHIVAYARKKGYFYVGRGSGANSIIAYLLQVTDVDPMELDLYFERFINLFRKNPPDFDMDFSWKDREDVTENIFQTFPNTALLATYSTFSYRSAVREIAKVMGLPKTETDLLAEGKRSPAEMDHIGQLVHRYAMYINGLPSHFSIHAGGIVISEKPLNWFGATHVPPKGYPTIQFSMLEAEDVGLYKFDVLSQRGLAKIEECLRIAAVNQPHKPVHDIHDMAYLKEDEGITRMLREGNALGCFYVESPAMRMLLLKLRVDNYLALVAASSIIRPGVAQSGMMRQYILRHLDPAKRTEAHPEMLRIMPETYGVMVYQEDVIKVAHEFAGLNLAEADILRRGMSGKFRSRKEFADVRSKFFSNCAQKGYLQSDTSEIWRQIESFAGFSFSKGHSASYAVESYQSLYLKCYYPLEYMVATINNGGGFYAAEIYVREVEMLGGKIAPPCINYGHLETTISGNQVYLGMGMISNIEFRMIAEIVEERLQNGLFADFNDLTERVYIPLEQLVLLIRSNALRTLGTCKKSLLWKARFHHSKRKPGHVKGLFKTVVSAPGLPPLEQDAYEDAFDELELLGFTLRNPFDLLPDSRDPGETNAVSVRQQLGELVTIFGYQVHIKKSTTSGGGFVYFGTFLDSAGNHFDTIYFNKQPYSPFREKGIYSITGKVAEEFGFYTVEVVTAEKIPYREDSRYID